MYNGRGEVGILLNNKIKRLREEQGISQQKLADVVGVSKSSISKYEKGERTPELATFEAIADYFNVDMDYLKGKAEIRKKYIVTEDGNYEYESILHDLMMTDSAVMVEILSKLKKMDEEERVALNKLLK